MRLAIAILCFVTSLTISLLFSKAEYGLGLANLMYDSMKDLEEFGQKDAIYGGFTGGGGGNDGSGGGND